MRRQLATTAVLTGTLVAGSVAGLATTAVADTCDAYSNECPTETPSVLPTSETKEPEVDANNSGLPFTGGEIVLLTAAGIAAIGAGTVLVATSRRRRGASH